MEKYCVIYTRVGTHAQVENTPSLEFQEEKAKKLADYNEWLVKGIYSDKGISGRSTKNREGLKNAIGSLEKGNILIIYSISRLSRSVTDALDIMKKLSEKEAEFVSITEKIDTSTPSGKDAFKLLLVMAELESDMISERIQGAMDLKKAKKQFVGRIPYGWKLSNGPGSDLSQDPDEQIIIRRIREMRKSPDGIRSMSLQNISDVLNKENIPCRQATCFRPVTIKRILERNVVITKGRDKQCETVDSISPEPISPESISPESISPESISPEHISPEFISLEHISPEHISPEHISSIKNKKVKLLDFDEDDLC